MCELLNVDRTNIATHSQTQLINVSKNPALSFLTTQASMHMCQDKFACQFINVPSILSFSYGVGFGVNDGINTVTVFFFTVREL